MKKVLILLACAAAIVACSKEEPIAINQGQAISFSNPFINKATRAELVTTNNLAGFDVWGTVTGPAGGTALIFNGAPIIKSGNVWVCKNATDVQYWVPGANYAFTAIKNYTPVTPAPAAMPETISYTQSSQGDLILAQAAVTGADADQDPVSLTFSHLLSKVAFTVNSNATNGYKHTVREITISNYESGTYDIEDEEWTPATPTTITYSDIENVVNGTPGGNESILFIPDTEKIIISFVVDFIKTVDTVDTVLKTDSYKLTNALEVDTDLLAGHAYNFTINLDAGNPIQFTATVTPWPAEDDDDDNDDNYHYVTVQ